MSHKATKCSSCPAIVIWAETEKGKRMPVDAKPVPNGNIYLVHRGQRKAPLAVHAKFDRIDGQKIPKYRAHFASCPNASRHRRRPSPKQEAAKAVASKDEQGQGDLPI